MALDELIENQGVPHYEPSKKEQELLDQIEDDWANAKQQREQSYRHIQLLGEEYDLETWWRRLRDHFNGRTEAATNVEDDWKSRHFKKRTRHKVIATIAQAQSANIGIDFRAVNREDDIDRVMSKVSEDLYDWSLEREDFDMKMLKADLVRAIEGTVHIYEEIAHDTKMQKEILNMDLETGEIEWEEKEVVEFEGPRMEIVPNVEMYPGDMWTEDIQQQPYVIRRKVTTLENATLFLSKYKNWDKVKGGNGNYFGSQDDESDKDEQEADMDSNEVEIIYYWRKSPELFAIIANGVLLTQPDHPIPHVHKTKNPYPFAKGIGENFADVRSYWGNSVVNNNFDEQELVNSIYRMIYDSTVLSIKPPLYTNSAELAGTDLVRPGIMATIGDDEQITSIPGLSNDPPASAINLLRLSEGQMDENSISPIATGQQVAGINTATEIEAIVGASRRLQGVNNQYYGSLILDHARLRIANLYWYLAHSEKTQKIVRPGIKVRGKEGKREIMFVDALSLPQGVSDVTITGEEITNAELRVFREEQKSEKSGVAADITLIPREIINNFDFFVSISPIPKPSRRAFDRINKVFNKFRLYASIPVIDQVENTKQLIEGLGDDPDTLLVRPEQQTAETEPIKTPDVRESAFAGGVPDLVS